MQARTTLFRDCASDHKSALYGEVSQDFLSMVNQRMGTTPTVFSFMQGLEQSATV